jgi:CheY-like chemotaxis protein
MVELHGGQVRVASEGPGCGTTLIVSFPLFPSKLLLESDVSTGEDGGAGLGRACRRIQVIEDNMDVAESLREVLELHGCTVSLVSSGPAALEAAREFRPEAVLCDLGLPGMDGYQVAAALRQDPELATVLLIAVSGYGQDEDRRRSHEAGFDLHLTKPVHFEELQRLFGLE